MKLSSLVNRQSIKYLLFDLTVLVVLNCLVAHNRKGLDGLFLAPVCNDETTISSPTTNHQIPTQPTVSRQLEQPTLSQKQQQQRDIPAFKVGDIVEVHDPSIHALYAFFAKISRVVNTSDRSILYKIRAGTNSQYEINKYIDPSNMKKHDTHAFGTLALCDYGEVETSSTVHQGEEYSFITSSKALAPCTLLGDGRLDSYYVRVTQNGKMRYQEVPLSRIRIIVQHPYHLESLNETEGDNANATSTQDAVGDESSRLWEELQRKYSYGTADENKASEQSRVVRNAQKELS